MVTGILEATSTLLFTAYCGFPLRIQRMRLVALVSGGTFSVALGTSIWTGEERVWLVANGVSTVALLIGLFSKEFTMAFKRLTQGQSLIAIGLFFAPLLPVVVISLGNGS
jgi:hypothetical protein